MAVLLSRFALVLLSIAFFARRMILWGRLATCGRLLIGLLQRRDNAGGRPSRFAACGYAGQVGNLRPIVNRPAGDLLYLLKQSRPTEEGELTIRRRFGNLPHMTASRKLCWPSSRIVRAAEVGRLTIGRRLPICPTKSQRAKKQKCSNTWLLCNM
jgi:hypothetical protein